MKASTLLAKELAERPEGYQGPNLSPRGLRLIPTQLATGTYALVANIPPKDNNGLVVGERAALVIDAGIVPDISAQIQQLAAQQTDRPLRYLVNTTYHGDHSFGNASFPAEVTVISSRINRDNMTDLAYEKARRAGNMYEDAALLDAVTDWRKPDVAFDSAAEIDLRGRVVQLLYFGPGNGPGDTIVYLPDAQVAWTGNYLSHAGIAPMLLQGGPTPYLASLRRMRAALPQVRTIVPGHGPVGDGHARDRLAHRLPRAGPARRRRGPPGRPYCAAGAGDLPLTVRRRPRPASGQRPGPLPAPAGHRSPSAPGTDAQPAPPQRARHLPGTGVGPIAPLGEADTPAAAVAAARTSEAAE